MSVFLSSLSGTQISPFSAPHYTVSCDLSDSTIFFHLPNKWNDLRGKKGNKSVCFDFIYNFSFKHFSFKEEFCEILS
jgi:hypothetical protein